MNLEQKILNRIIYRLFCYEVVNFSNVPTKSTSRRFFFVLVVNRLYLKLIDSYAKSSLLHFFTSFYIYVLFK